MTLDGCVPPEPCTEGQTISCQDPDIPGDECCCFNKSHTLDLEVTVPSGTEVSCCIRTGLNCGCTGDAIYEVSNDGIVWEEVSVFETVSDKVGGVCPNESVAWVDHCMPFTAPGDYSAQIFAILIVTVGAVEMAIGLALVMLLYRQRRSVDVDAYTDLRR